MPKFFLSLEATAFADDRDDLDATLEGTDCIQMIEGCKADGTLPQGVLAVLRGHISEDDGQDDTDIHCFVCVDLLIEGKSLKAVQNLEPLSALLERVSAHLTGDTSVDLDSSTWEVVDARLATDDDVVENLPAPEDQAAESAPVETNS